MYTQLPSWVHYPKEKWPASLTDLRPATATSPLRLASIFEFMHKTKARCQNLLKLSNPNNLCVKKAAIFSFYSWQSFLNHFNFSIINFCLKQGTMQNTFGILNDILQDNFLNLYAFLFFSPLLLYLFKYQQCF